MGGTGGGRGGGWNASDGALMFQPHFLVAALSDAVRRCCLRNIGEFLQCILKLVHTAGTVRGWLEGVGACGMGSNQAAAVLY